jgi:predicted SprT family Zn-dependent metalloprotease
MTPMQTYDILKAAFDFFNAELFEGRLAEPLITLHRHRSAYGYFCADRFAQAESFDDVKEVSRVHEIALNPQHIRSRSPFQTFATLVHEMVHQEQQEYGTPPKGPYHNKQWAAWMKRVGLQPSDTAEPGGKETGRYVSHFVMKFGRFDTAFEKFQAGRDLSLFGDLPVMQKEKAKTSKFKFECPGCGQNAWAKATAILSCGECALSMECVD